jgi:hypothetical protein
MTVAHFARDRRGHNQALLQLDRCDWDLVVQRAEAGSAYGGGLQGVLTPRCSGSRGHQIERDLTEQYALGAARRRGMGAIGPGARLRPYLLSQRNGQSGSPRAAHRCILADAYGAICHS